MVSLADPKNSELRRKLLAGEIAATEMVRAGRNRASPFQAAACITTV
jgi:hypothetical protein